MVLMQNSQLCKLSLGGDKCEHNFNKFNTSVIPSTSSICVGESSKQRAQLKDTRAFGRHHAKKGSTKPNNSSWVMYENPNTKGITCNYCTKRGHVKVKCNEQLLVDYNMMKSIPNGMFLQAHKFQIGNCN